MTDAPAFRLARGTAFAALTCLSACAAEPKPAPSAPVAAPTAAAPLVTMAPIANPQASRPAEAGAPRVRSGEAPVRRHAAPAHPLAPIVTSPGPAPARVSGADPAGAARLRARGLEELNRGASAKAVELLSEASRLDPDSALIRRDLGRAERINRAVHVPH